MTPRKRPNWPAWWEWELEITPHVEKRMEDRGFTEVELRSMLADADDYRADILDGRWVVDTKLNRTEWEVIVEPDHDVELLVVVTAYPVG